MFDIALFEHVSNLPETKFGIEWHRIQLGM